MNITTSKGTLNFLLVLNIKECTLLALHVSIEGNNLILVLTCKKMCLGLIFKKHLALVVSVFCFFFFVMCYWNQDLTLMFWGSFSSRVTQCRYFFGVILVIRTYDHIAQDYYKIVQCVNTGMSTFSILSSILGKWRM